MGIFLKKTNSLNGDTGKVGFQRRGANKGFKEEFPPFKNLNLNKTHNFLESELAGNLIPQKLGFGGIIPPILI